MKQPIIIETPVRSVTILKCDQDDYEGTGLNPPSEIVAIDPRYNRNACEIAGDEVWDNINWYVHVGAGGSETVVGFDAINIDDPSDVDYYSPRVAEILGWPIEDVKALFQQAVSF